MILGTKQVIGQRLKKNPKSLKILVPQSNTSRRNLEYSDLVIKKASGSDNVLGGHGGQLLVLEARIFYHTGSHLIPINSFSLSKPREFSAKDFREREQVECLCFYLFLKKRFLFFFLFGTQKKKIEVFVCVLLGPNLGLRPYFFRSSCNPNS